jgi:hypothetical protein
VSWGDWFGYEPRNDRKWRPFLEAREFIYSLRLKNLRDWQKYRRGGFPDLPSKPDDIPVAPEYVYAEKGWLGNGDWIGTGNQKYRRVVPRDFNLARDFARSLKLSSRTEWRNFAYGKMKNMQKRPADIPGEPDKTYADKGWAGWDDWLGRSAG